MKKLNVLMLTLGLAINIQATQHTIIDTISESARTFMGRAQEMFTNFKNTNMPQISAVNKTATDSAQPAINASASTISTAWNSAKTHVSQAKSYGMNKFSAGISSAKNAFNGSIARIQSIEPKYAIAAGITAGVAAAAFVAYKVCARYKKSNAPAQA